MIEKILDTLNENLFPNYNKWGNISVSLGWRNSDVKHITLNIESGGIDPIKYESYNYESSYLLAIIGALKTIYADNQEKLQEESRQNLRLWQEKYCLKLDSALEATIKFCEELEG